MSPSVTDMALPSVNKNQGGGGQGSTSFFKVRVREEKEVQEAKQRASIKWLLMKAYNNKPPDELRDPFYRDHDDLERLKPHVVHALANAELYCMALSHLYADPNYHNLNHWGIIQALARKGVYVAEPPDCALTETVLIQTTPLKMTAHMAVMEALMALTVKEQVTADRVVAAVRRFSKMEEVPGDQEEALLLWIDKSCHALREKVQAELGEEKLGENSRVVPKFCKLQDLSDLSDGVGLAGVISLYCPQDLLWTEIALGDPASMADSLYNIRLVQRFCGDTLPNNISHLTIEDIVYMHSSIKLNVVCLLADLFTVLESKPASCVKLPGSPKDQIIEMPDPALQRGYTGLRGVSLEKSLGAIPDLRPSLDQGKTQLLGAKPKIQPKMARGVCRPSGAVLEISKPLIDISHSGSLTNLADIRSKSGDIKRQNSMQDKKPNRLSLQDAGPGQRRR